MTASSTTLKFASHESLRQRLVLATLTGQPIHIAHIRPNSTSPGLTPSEFSFLRLLDSITNGSFFEISVTGTALLYKPGLITGGGGKLIRHTLPPTCTRGVSYYLEALALLAPFSKAAFSVVLDGGVITAATASDYSVDTFRTAILPLYAPFDIARGLEVRVLRRSSGPRAGAGEVHFLHAHQVRLPRTLHLTAPGRVKRIRGVAYATGVAAGNNARMIDAARGVLNPLLPDVYVFSDVAAAPLVAGDYGRERPAATPGPRKKTGVGFGLSLVAETGTGCVYAADAFAAPGEPAEDVGLRAAYCLLEEVELGGCVGRVGVGSVLAMMMMGTEGDVGRLVIGKGVVGAELVQALRDLKRFFGAEVGVREGEREDTVLLSVVGRGVGNVGRKLA